nr:MAG TPA: hypothetical protein [Caudoviricetes sp.]
MGLPYGYPNGHPMSSILIVFVKFFVPQCTLWRRVTLN